MEAVNYRVLNPDWEPNDTKADDPFEAKLSKFPIFLDLSHQNHRSRCLVAVGALFIYALAVLSIVSPPSDSDPFATLIQFSASPPSFAYSNEIFTRAPSLLVYDQDGFIMTNTPVEVFILGYANILSDHPCNTANKQLRSTLGGLRWKEICDPPLNGDSTVSGSDGLAFFNDLTINDATPGVYTLRFQSGSAHIDFDIDVLSRVVDLYPLSLPESAPRIGESVGGLTAYVVDLDLNPVAGRKVFLTSANVYAPDGPPSTPALPLNNLYMSVEGGVSSVTGADGIARWDNVTITGSTNPNGYVWFVCEGSVRSFHSKPTDFFTFPPTVVSVEYNREGTDFVANNESGSTVYTIQAVENEPFQSGILTVKDADGNPLPNRRVYAVLTGGDMVQFPGGWAPQNFPSKYLLNPESELTDDNGQVQFTDLILTTRGRSGVCLDGNDNPTTCSYFVSYVCEGVVVPEFDNVQVETTVAQVTIESIVNTDEVVVGEQVEPYPALRVVDSLSRGVEGKVPLVTIANEDGTDVDPSLYYIEILSASLQEPSLPDGFVRSLFMVVMFAADEGQYRFKFIVDGVASEPSEPFLLRHPDYADASQCAFIETVQKPPALDLGFLNVVATSIYSPLGPWGLRAVNEFGEPIEGEVIYAMTEEVYGIVGPYQLTMSTDQSTLTQYIELTVNDAGKKEFVTIQDGILGAQFTNATDVDGYTEDSYFYYWVQFPGTHLFRFVNAAQTCISQRHRVNVQVFGSGITAMDIPTTAVAGEPVPLSFYLEGSSSGRVQVYVTDKPDMILGDTVDTFALDDLTLYRYACGMVRDQLLSETYGVDILGPVGAGLLFESCDADGTTSWERANTDILVDWDTGIWQQDITFMQGYPGTYTLVAVTSGAWSSPFYITVEDPVASLEIVQQPASEATIGNRLSQMPQVRVVDSEGNPLEYFRLKAGIMPVYYSDQEIEDLLNDCLNDHFGNSYRASVTCSYWCVGDPTIECWSECLARPEHCPADIPGRLNYWRQKFGIVSPEGPFEDMYRIGELVTDAADMSLRAGADGIASFEDIIFAEGSGDPDPLLRELGYERDVVCYQIEITAHSLTQASSGIQGDPRNVLTDQVCVTNDIEARVLMTDPAQSTVATNGIPMRVPVSIALTSSGTDIDAFGGFKVYPLLRKVMFQGTQIPFVDAEFRTRVTTYGVFEFAPCQIEQSQCAATSEAEEAKNVDENYALSLNNLSLAGLEPGTTSSLEILVGGASAGLAIDVLYSNQIAAVEPQSGPDRVVLGKMFEVKVDVMSGSGARMRDVWVTAGVTDETKNEYNGSIQEGREVARSDYDGVATFRLLVATGMNTNNFEVYFQVGKVRSQVNLVFELENPIRSVVIRTQPTPTSLEFTISSLNKGQNSIDEGFQWTQDVPLAVQAVDENGNPLPFTNAGIELVKLSESSKSDVEVAIDQLNEFIKVLAGQTNDVNQDPDVEEGDAEIDDGWEALMSIDDVERVITFDNLSFTTREVGDFGFRIIIDGVESSITSPIAITEADDLVQEFLFNFFIAVACLGIIFIFLGNSLYYNWKWVILSLATATLLLVLSAAQDKDESLTRYVALTVTTTVCVIYCLIFVVMGLIDWTRFTEDYYQDKSAGIVGQNKFKEFSGYFAEKRLHSYRDWVSYALGPKAGRPLQKHSPFFFPTRVFVAALLCNVTVVAQLIYFVALIESVVDSVVALETQSVTTLSQVLDNTIASLEALYIPVNNGNQLLDQTYNAFTVLIDHFKELRESIEDSLITGCTMAVLLFFLSWFFLLRDIRTKIIAVRRGNAIEDWYDPVAKTKKKKKKGDKNSSKVSQTGSGSGYDSHDEDVETDYSEVEKKEREKKPVMVLRSRTEILDNRVHFVDGCNYLGIQISNAILSFFVISFLVALCMFPIRYRLTREFIQAQWKTILVLCISPLVNVILKKVTAYNLWTNPQGIYYECRPYFHVYDMSQMFVQIFTGIVTAMVRMSIQLAVSILSLSRIHTSLFPAWVERYLLLDTGNKAYQGMLIQEKWFNHPVTLTFCDLVLKEIADRNKFSNKAETQTEVSSMDRSRRISYRWHLMYTLHHNPSIRKYRKHYIVAKRAEIEYEQALLEARLEDQQATTQTHDGMEGWGGMEEDSKKEHNFS